MANSLKKCLDDILQLSLKTNSGIKKITQPNGTVGTRRSPPQMPERDKTIGGRLDYSGDKDDGNVKQLNFQVNKGAKNKTLKDLADKYSHKVWATVDVPVDQEATPENAEKIIEDLKKNISL